MGQFTDNQEASRFELAEEGGVVRADYRRVGALVAVTHVVTPPVMRGQGAAARLMDAIVEKARAEGFKIRPSCSYAAHYFEAHPAARDVVAST
jgi:predicted GNAT family acetyltransferase